MKIIKQMEMVFQQSVAIKKGRRGILYLVLALAFFGCKPKNTKTLQRYKKGQLISSKTLNTVSL
jgi:hypothetical protein